MNNRIVFPYYHKDVRNKFDDVIILYCIVVSAHTNKHKHRQLDIGVGLAT